MCVSAKTPVGIASPVPSSWAGIHEMGECLDSRGSFQESFARPVDSLDAFRRRFERAGNSAARDPEPVTPLTPAELADLVREARRRWRRHQRARTTVDDLRRQQSEAVSACETRRDYARKHPGKHKI